MIFDQTNDFDKTVIRWPAAESFYIRNQSFEQIHRVHIYLSIYSYVQTNSSLSRQFNVSVNLHDEWVRYKTGYQTMPISSVE